MSKYCAKRIKTLNTLIHKVISKQPKKEVSDNEQLAVRNRTKTDSMRKKQANILVVDDQEEILFSVKMSCFLIYIAAI